MTQAETVQQSAQLPDILPGTGQHIPEGGNMQSGSLPNPAEMAQMMETAKAVGTTSGENLSSTQAPEATNQQTATDLANIIANLSEGMPPPVGEEGNVASNQTGQTTKQIFPDTGQAVAMTAAQDQQSGKDIAETLLPNGQAITDGSDTEQAQTVTTGPTSQAPSDASVIIQDQTAVLSSAQEMAGQQQATSGHPVPTAPTPANAMADAQDTQVNPEAATTTAKDESGETAKKADTLAAMAASGEETDETDVDAATKHTGPQSQISQGDVGQQTASRTDGQTQPQAQPEAQPQTQSQAQSQTESGEVQSAVIDADKPAKAKAQSTGTQAVTQQAQADQQQPTDKAATPKSDTAATDAANKADDPAIESKSQRTASDKPDNTDNKPSQTMAHHTHKSEALTKLMAQLEGQSSLNDPAMQGDDTIRLDNGTTLQGTGASVRLTGMEAMAPHRPDAHPGQHRQRTGDGRPGSKIRKQGRDPRFRSVLTRPIWARWMFA